VGSVDKLMAATQLLPAPGGEHSHLIEHRTLTSTNAKQQPSRQQLL
jgi:hypothetical protein